jgi:hypothetical protein
MDGTGDVARELAAEGRRFDEELSENVRARCSVLPVAPSFHKAIVEAARWAGWADGDEWSVDALRYLETQAPHLRSQYRGYRGGGRLLPYLDTWCRILLHPDVPSPPGATTSGHQVVRFARDALTALKQLEWQHERAGLGPWTFFGAFKIYLLHEQRLWTEPSIDAIVLPLGGGDGGHSFEGGWENLRQLGFVDALPPGRRFEEGLVRTEIAHASVLRLAGLAGTRALHVNSGIYRLGSPIS